MMVRFHRALVSCLAFVVPIIAYWLTLAPDITWAYQGADGGDLITAAYNLGVPHPSGYPTYVLLGWLVQWLPLGTIAWRFNFFSALATSGAAWLIFRTTYIASQSHWAALIGAWLFAFLPSVWSQALITEVYALNLMFVALLLWLGAQIWLGRTAFAVWLGFTFGLALGNHLTIVALLPSMGWILYREQRATWLKAGLGLLVGLLIYFYLPLRAGQGPITWGRPSTWAGFWSYVSGQLYHDYVFRLPLSLLGPRVLAVAGYVSELDIVGLMASALGVYWAWSQARAILSWVMVSIAAYLIYAVGYRTADSFVYLLPIFAFSAIGAGLGLQHHIFALLPHRWRWIAGCSVLIIILVSAGFRSQRLTLHNDLDATRFWQTIMAEAPSEAVLLSYQDNHTFTLWYAHYVLKRRPDLAIVDTGLASYTWHQRDLQRLYPRLTQVATLADVFQQQKPYPYPLCAITQETGEEAWKLNCLQNIK